MNTGGSLVVAFVLIRTKAGKELDVVEKVKEMGEVKDAWAVYGEFDIIARVEVESMPELNSFILEKLRKMSDIVMTSTLITMEV